MIALAHQMSCNCMKTGHAQELAMASLWSLCKQQVSRSAAETALA